MERYVEILAEMEFKQTAASVSVPPRSYQLCYPAYTDVNDLCHCELVQSES